MRSIELEGPPTSEVLLQADPKPAGYQSVAVGKRVPFAIRWPGEIPAGGTCDHPAIAIAAFTTALTTLVSS